MGQYPRRLTYYLTIASCAINFLVALIWNYRGIERDIPYSYIGHDYPETLPLPFGELDNVLLTVEESVRYGLAGEGTDAQWEALSPKGGGFINLGPNNRLFLVSMFHQVHCLRFFNWAFDPKFEGLYKLFASKGHNAHCLNYLRQRALCSADLTLEKGDFVERNFTVDRVGATHTCKDWGTVYRIMEENVASKGLLPAEHA
ncbi:hypothetical protein CC1G_09584 [Coprinopsis cinerea okayama7|uniref:Oxidase ustYa n=1 Tax=Coprinopsis cinerea (strain Okayama-7 / 130 / ATCC MYA-4618 / FGSC 9003) TaxID=240176 RepID=A8P995_COPC7|nr:hypothetical protein CC1G_09584 [Coprinopsis cinerea okayama7\|eukprot:XP_001839729.1 hypothetical protein CC1G_09584 [Coprinopsis cinerea okayama7\